VDRPAGVERGDDTSILGDAGRLDLAHVLARVLPEFIGRGWGKHLLTRAVLSAWDLGTQRVWLHTCTLDHPAALPNYLKRGFRRVRDEVYELGGQAAKFTS
jgi:GNAT superfamily N-acetyltransferase